MFRSSAAEGFISFVNQAKDLAKTMSIADIVNHIVTDSGYEKYIRELGDEERLENLAEFKRIASEFERSFGEELSLPEFLFQLLLPVSS